MSLHEAMLTAVALSLLASARGLLQARVARTTGVLLALTGLGLLLGVVLDATGSPDAAVRAWVAAALLLGPLALVLYPVARWRDPVDFLAIVTVVAGGSLATVLPETGEAMTLLVVLLVVPAHIWWRLEHSRDEERRAATWMALAAGSSTLLAGLVSFAAGDSSAAAAGEAASSSSGRRCTSARPVPTPATPAPWWCRWSPT